MRILILFALFLSFKLSAQIAPERKFKLTPIVGFRLHNAAGYLPVVKIFQKHMVTSPSIGLILSKGNFPISFSWQSDFSLNLTPGIIDSNVLGSHRIYKTRFEHQMRLHYSLKRVSFGLGYYWRRQESAFNHWAPGVFVTNYSGLLSSVNIPINWLQLECRYALNFTPLGSLGLWDNLSLMTLIRLDKNSLNQNNFKKIGINGLIGTRFFSTKNIQRVPGEVYNAIGISPLLGVEVIHNKSHISIGIEKDWFLSLNGGSSKRDVKAKINSSFVSIGYHKQLENTRSLRFRVGLSFIEDSDFEEEQTLFNTPKSLLFYQVKGIGATVSYELFPEMDIEIKHTFPWAGDKLFNPTRLSLGLIYRYNPIKAQ